MAEPSLINGRIILRLRDARKTIEDAPDLEKHVMLKTLLEDESQHLHCIQPEHLDWKKFRARMEQKLGIRFDPVVTEITWTDITFRDNTSPQDNWIIDEWDFHNAINGMYGQRPRRSQNLVFVLNIYQPGVARRFERSFSQ